MGINPIPKITRIRLNRNTKAWHELEASVIRRDGSRCVACKGFVMDLPLHHEPPKGVGGEDVYEKLCVVCINCHHERHHGKHSKVVKNKIVNYLNNATRFLQEAHHETE